MLCPSSRSSLSRSPHSLRASLLCTVGLLLAPCLPAQTPQHGPAPRVAPLIPQRSPRDWAALACEHEIAAIDHTGPWLRYRTHVIDSKSDRNRIVIESKDGTIARTVAVNGKPLSPDEDAEERKRLQDVAASPTAFARHMKSDASGRKIAVELIGDMPDAMIYTPLSGDQGHSPTGAPLLGFSYAPNPKWNAPTTTAEALTGLRGQVWVDSSNGWVVRMTGEIFRPVNFGYGVLARLFPGGTVSVDQSEVGGGRWIYHHFEDNLHVRALMLKTIEVRTEVTATDFQQLPGPLTYQQAIDLLLKAPLQ